MRRFFGVYAVVLSGLLSSFTAPVCAGPCDLSQLQSTLLEHDQEANLDEVLQRDEALKATFTACLKDNNRWVYVEGMRYGREHLAQPHANAERVRNLRALQKETDDPAAAVVERLAGNAVAKVTSILTNLIYAEGILDGAAFVVPQS